MLTPSPSGRTRGHPCREELSCWLQGAGIIWHRGRYWLPNFTAINHPEWGHPYFMQIHKYREELDCTRIEHWVVVGRIPWVSHASKGLPGLLRRNCSLMRPWGIPWESTAGPSQRVEKAQAERGWENGGAKISVRCCGGAWGGLTGAVSECKLKQQLIASALTVPLQPGGFFGSPQSPPVSPRLPKFHHFLSRVSSLPALYRRDALQTSV